MAHILSNSCSSRPLRTPLKSINHASKYPIYERYHYFDAQFIRDTMFCHESHEKDAQNGVIGWFTTKICSKWQNSIETLHIDCEIFFGISKHQ